MKSFPVTAMDKYCTMQGNLNGMLLEVNRNE